MAADPCLIRTYHFWFHEYDDAGRMSVAYLKEDGTKAILDLCEPNIYSLSILPGQLPQAVNKLQPFGNGIEKVHAVNHTNTQIEPREIPPPASPEPPQEEEEPPAEEEPSP